MKNVPESAVDGIMILCMFLWQRVKEAAGRIALGVNPWNVKIFVSGCAGLLYLVLGIALVALVLVDGFGRHFKRDCFLCVVLLILFVVSCIK